MPTPANPSVSTDCDDGDIDTFPGAASIDHATDCMTDADGDDYGDSSAVAPVIPGTDCNDAVTGINPGATEIVGDGIDQDCDTEELCYEDLDGDTFGSTTTVTSVNLSCADAGESTVSTDCADGDIDTFPGAASIDHATDCMTDADGDDYGDSSAVAPVIPGTDCNDAVTGINPGATEIVGDGIDQDCDTEELCYEDLDGDTFGSTTTVTSVNLSCADAGESTVSTDCADGDINTFPGAASIDHATDCMTDADGDDYGDSSAVAPVIPGTDCNDAVTAINPGATEIVGDGIDQDCDTEELCYEDLDGDTFGSTTTVTSVNLSCADAGESTVSTDCADGDINTFPGAASIDHATDCMTDADGDDYGDSSAVAPVIPGTDCNDAVSGINPGATEIVGDGIDQDCDTEELCYEDLDGDTFGTTTTVTSANLTCADAGESLVSTDCDDGDIDTFPGAASIDHATDCMTDADGDDYGDSSAVAPVIPGTDCNDAVSAINPGATEIVGDGIDQNCDTEELCYVDSDGDTFGTTTTVTSVNLSCADAGESTVSTDCDDGDINTFPGAASIDHATDCMTDADGDDYGDSSAVAPVIPGTDCNDAVSAINPGATEIVGDGIDQNCDTEELCYEDLDGDTFGSTTTVTSVNLSCADAGESTVSTDCDDGETDTFPGAAPIDHATDCMTDADGDDYGDSSAVAPVIPGTDCNDAVSGINPGATEIVGDGIDQDCDTEELCYEDLDGDTFGSTTTVTSVNLSCADAGESTVSTDCADGDIDTFPGAASIDHATDCMTDADGDDYGDSSAVAPVIPGTDCNDAVTAINPGATEIVGDGIDQDCDTEELCYEDLDGDTFGSTTTVTSVNLSCADAGESTVSTDCADGDINTFPGAASIDHATDCMTDADGDDYGDSSAVAPVIPGTDCNDAVTAINPGATEIVGDGIDQDCDTEELCYEDLDGDTFGSTTTVTSVNLSCADAGESTVSTDCADGDINTFPGAASIDHATDCMTDADGDDYGDSSAVAPVIPGTDCNDAVSGINPGATEIVGDGIDQDCDTEELCYEDLDGDTFGTTTTVTSANLTCADAGESLVSTDCDDGDIDTFPGAASIDHATDCMTDADGDDYGDSSAVAPVIPGTDCNDAVSAINPGATEIVGDGIDQNCDTEELCYVDSDGDTFGTTTTVTSVNLSCADAGESTVSTDCDDGDINTFPGAASIDHATDCMTDADGDDYGDSSAVAPVIPGTDCNDAVSAINPGATEIVGDGIDQNCDTEELCYEDLDGDTFGSTTTVTSVNLSCADAGESTVSTDCDDGETDTFPGAAPIDHATDCMTDADGDDYGDSSAVAPVIPGTDCNDAVSGINPGATEIVGDGIDQDCDTEELCYEDLDGDTFGSTTTVTSVNLSCADAGESTVSTDCADGDIDTFPGAASIDHATDCMTDADGDDYGDSSAVAPVIPGTDCNDAVTAINPGATEIVGDGIDQDCDTEELCYEDLDGDTFGSTTTVTSVNLSCADAGESTVSTDCADGDINTFPGAASIDHATDCMTDADGDDYGDSSAVAPVIPGTDCNDAVTAINPGATEIVGDGIDQDCDTEELCYEDLDGDTFGSTTTVTSVNLSCADAGESTVSTDCADGDINTFPGAASIDHATDCMTDADGDDYGDSSAVAPVIPGTDCNDAVSGINPGATEIVGDGIDQDCDTEELCYEDLDGDTFGTTTTVTSANLTCADAGESLVSTDCDDGDIDTFPGAASIDHATDCMTDADGDDYGDSSAVAPVIPGTDCNDAVSAINPGATEIVGDGIDQNCDTEELCYVDSDGDTFGTTTTVTSVNLSCADAGESTVSTDCDDGDINTFPGAASIDHATDCMTDADGDDYGDSSAVAPVIPGTDCNDAVSAINPGATEIVGDGIDQNCDTEELCYEDLDGDTFGSTTTVTSVNLSCADAGESTVSTDCDDGETDTFPGAAPIDHATDCMTDADGDDYGDSSAVAPVIPGTDCNDAVSGINPGATEIVGDGIDQDCDTEELCYEDLDGDTFGSTTTVTSVNLSCADAGESTVSTDCADGDIDTFPGAASIDHATDCMTDADGDDYGDSSAVAPVIPGTDCNDAVTAINPGATEIVGDGIDQDCDTEELCYEDLDGDTFGSTTTVTSVNLSCADAGESTVSTDCADGDINTFPGAASIDHATDCMTDADGDDYGDSSAVAPVIPGTDCNDAVTAINPGATEIVGDGIDQDCDTEELCYEDLDGDTFGSTTTVTSVNLSCADAGESTVSTDCADGDINTFPGAASIDHATDCMTDADGDDYGDSSAVAPVIPGTDCNDAVSGINPGATEIVGDGIDQDCDTEELCYEDLDGDTFGTTTTVTSANLTCADAGESLVSTDCDDGDIDTFPGAASIDHATDCMTDADGDDYGDSSAVAPVIPGTDCNDAVSAINPGATEIVGDGIDQNCDTEELCYVDSDGDTFGTTTTVTSVNLSCADAGESTVSTDCDDGDINTFPGAASIDHATDCMTDADGDDYGDSSAVAPVIPGTDCNDAVSAINPGATEIVGDGIDQNCDTEELCYEDLDGDTFGSTTTVTSVNLSCADAGESTVSTDCDDGETDTFPGAAPIDHATDCMTDADGDDYGDSSAVAPVIPGTDCNDAVSGINPGATEIVGDGIDQDCDTEELCYEDLDGDTFGSTTTVTSVNLSCADAGESTVSTDCADGDIDTFPGAASIDHATDCMTDADGDDYGDSSAVAPVIPGTDCNDAVTAINPGATEIVGDGIDQDCDTEELCYEDLDGDTFGSTTTVTSVNLSCADAGESTVSTDCADGDINTFPGAASIDHATDCMTDADGDDYGDSSAVAPVIPGTDCNDAVTAINPGATEIVGDGIDQDCDTEELCYEDLDGDTFGSTTTVTSVNLSCADAGESTVSTDCADGDINTFPGAASIDHATDCMTDADGDDYGDSSAVAPVIPGTDCNDAVSGINPGATEIVGDGIDQDCDTEELCYEDLDGDTFGTTTTVTSANLTCADAGESLVSTDCDDGDIDTFPGALRRSTMPRTA